MKVSERLAGMLVRYSSQVLLGWLALTAVLSLGLVNVKIESDPENLWVSKDSTTYKQQQQFKDRFGAFFRTEQLLLVQKSGRANVFNKTYLYSLYLLQSLI
jgi:Niemann-Pick C1 protein